MPNDVEENHVPRPGPLHGIRVLDLSRLLPGPFCSLILAELGAEVIKIEDTGPGDYLRLIPPQKEGLGGAFYALNRGKRSIALDLKQPAGRDIFFRLLAESRVVIESFRPGVMARLGLGYEALARVRDDIILCSISGYGQTGPYTQRAGHDIDYLAISGVLAAGGQDQGQPALPGIQLADIAGGGLWAAVRILAALYSGHGAQLDVSMTEGAMSFLLPWLGDYLFAGAPLRRGTGTLNGGNVRYNTYATADGKHLAVGALEPKFWATLCGVLGLPVAAQAKISSFTEENLQQEQLQHAFAGAARDEWCARLSGVDACVEPVLEMDELFDHPLHQQRQMFYSLADPVRGALPLLRLPLDTEPGSSPAPQQGEHTDLILREVGFSEQEIARFHAEKTVL